MIWLDEDVRVTALEVNLWLFDRDPARFASASGSGGSLLI
jgi:hypothetical protein